MNVEAYKMSDRQLIKGRIQKLEKREKELIDLMKIEADKDKFADKAFNKLRNRLNSVLLQIESQKNILRGEWKGVKRKTHSIDINLTKK